MQLEVKGNTIVCTREPGDPRLSKGGWAGGWAPEHRLLYWVKKALAKQGVVLIKTPAGRDFNLGIMHHLTDDKLPYLRQPVKTLGKEGPWDVLIYHSNYMLESVMEPWNTKGVVTLTINGDAPCEPKTFPSTICLRRSAAVRTP